MSITISPWQLNHLDTQLIELAFTEDLGLPYHDLTTNLLFPEIKSHSRARILSKHPEPIIFCGLQVVDAVLSKICSSMGMTKNDQWCYLHSNYKDGDRVPPHATLMTITGPAHVLLMVERTLLNFLQRLCAIATMADQFVQKVQHTHTRILDTRKTLPGFRHLEKYAVQCGGGVNHRMGLYDAVMIKDTHIDLLNGMAVALTMIPEGATKKFPVIVEVRTQSELNIILEKGLEKVSRILLDNMPPTQMQECVNLCNGILPLEASGNVDLHNVAAIAETGVDFISVGKITHSAGNIDLSMKCDIDYA